MATLNSVELAAEVVAGVCLKRPSARNDLESPLLTLAAINDGRPVRSAAISWGRFPPGPTQRFS